MLRTIIIALILFTLDALMLNSFIIALIAGVVIVIKFFKSEKLTRQQLLKGGIYAFMIIMIITANGINNRIAKSRAEMLITYCEKYKQKHGAYPTELTDLVPEFLDKIPPPKYLLGNNEFHYLSWNGKHTLYYVLFQPFGARMYHFETHKWHSTD